MIKKLLLLACVVTLTACPGEDLQTHHEGQWLIRNKTDQELLFRVPLPSDNSPYDTKIKPNELISLQEYNFYNNSKDGKTPYFEAIYLRDAAYHDFSWFEIRTVDQILLRRWELADKDEPGKQFFSASSWNYAQLKRGKMLDVSWTFEINPEDIE